jgi:hypothetical protein
VPGPGAFMSAAGISSTPGDGSRFWSFRVWDVEPRQHFVHRTADRDNRQRLVRHDRAHRNEAVPSGVHPKKILDLRRVQVAVPAVSRSSHCARASAQRPAAGPPSLDPPARPGKARLSPDQAPPRSPAAHLALTLAFAVPVAGAWAGEWGGTCRLHGRIVTGPCACGTRFPTTC